MAGIHANRAREAGEGGSPEPPGRGSPAELPTLYQDRAFWGMTVTQFLGAFNDNLFKQLVLLLSVAGAAASSSDPNAQDLQWVAMFVFALPFVLFSGLAGFLSDRNGKRTVIVLSKVAEIAVMSLGMAAFAGYAYAGLTGSLAVLFLMGTQSTFFGPGKYGILPEMLRGADLPRANGIILMTTFVAIILGTAVAGFLKLLPANLLWVSSGCCVTIAVLGTCTSLMIRRVPPARPDLKFQRSALAVPADLRRLLLEDHPLMAALLASCMFWMVGGIVQPTVNVFGIRQLGKNEALTSLMVAGMAIGIATGCLTTGLISRGRFDGRMVRVGLWGMIVCLAMLALPGAETSHFLGFAGSVPALIALGFFAGMFAVPVQVFLQSRPPDDKKGRMIATMNLANWIAILASAVLYFLFGAVLRVLGWQPSAMFGFTAVLMLPVALIYRPKSEQLV